jgi:hypothetical protein
MPMSRILNKIKSDKKQNECIFEKRSLIQRCIKAVGGG